MKFFKVGEHGKLDVVAESFNLLNHTNVVALNQFYGNIALTTSVIRYSKQSGYSEQLQLSLDFEF